MAVELGVGRLVDREPAGGDLVLLEMEPPVGFAATYRRAGQYVEVAAGGDSTYFVLGGKPGDARWQLFVRPGGDVADTVLALGLGREVMVSTALGVGFPVDEVATRRLLVVATGSGIAAVRPVVNERVRTGATSSTELFAGVRRRDELPLANDIARWKGAGVTVTLCLSREAPPRETGFFGGYVQDALQESARRQPEALVGAMVFAAGGTRMIDAVRSLATSLGVSEADVRTNY
jgi:sulfhydrogenase subunit gamma (sulfur reductase)